MGSSAQNSSGMHWCRRRVRFNKVPEKVPKVPEKVFGAETGQVQQGSGEGFRRRLQEALVQSQVRFNKVLEKVPEKVLEKVWEALVKRQVRLNRVPEKVPEKVPGSLGANPSQVPRVP